MNIKFEDSLYYQIHVSEKFFHMLFDQFFKSIDVGVNAMEYLALKVIDETKNCCQRDLARIILKDRANSGKLALSLEKKGLIKIELKTKNNRPVKILTITPEGQEILKKTSELSDITQKIVNEMSVEVLEETKKNLKKFREIVKDAMKINI